MLQRSFSDQYRKDVQKCNIAQKFLTSLAGKPSKVGVICSTQVFPYYWPFPHRKRKRHLHTYLTKKYAAGISQTSTQRGRERETAMPFDDKKII